jgi:hypothetical protein
MSFFMASSLVNLREFAWGRAYKASRKRAQGAPDGRGHKPFAQRAKALKVSPSKMQLG